MTLMVLSAACPALADGHSATISTSPSPAISTKSLEVKIQTRDMGSEVYCYTWCESVNGEKKSPFYWDEANNEKFRMGGSGGSYTISIPDIQAFYGLSDSEITGLTKLGFIAKTKNGQQTQDLFVDVEQGRRDVYGGGEGTRESPYILYTSAHLSQFSTDSRDWASDVFVRLDADIDASALTTPIGSVGNPYKGHFDGAGHSLTNLNLTDNSYGSACGLFAATNGAEIINLGVINANVSGVNHVGILVGKTVNTRIERCFATGEVAGRSICVGGLVGENIASTITDCYAGVKVDNADDYATGGIVGKNSGTVRNVYATGEIHGKDYVGGIVGANYGTIRNSVAINGRVSGMHDYTARFGGNNNTRNQSYNNHSWDKIATGESLHGDHASQHSALYLADFTSFSSITNWDFDNVWEWITEGKKCYPALRGLGNQEYILPSSLYDIVTGVEDLADDGDFRINVGPNPFVEYVGVASSAPLRSVSLYSLGGALILTADCNGGCEATVSAGALSAGIYLLNVVTADGRSYSFKVNKK